MPEGNQIKVIINNKEGYFDLDAKKEIIPCKYDIVNPNIYKKPYLFKFKLKDKEGYIDSLGVEVIENGI